MKAESKRVGVGTVSQELRDKFDAFCQANGFIKGRVLEGAVTMFMGLQQDQQLDLMRKANTPKQS